MIIRRILQGEHEHVLRDKVRERRSEEKALRVKAGADEEDANIIYRNELLSDYSIFSGCSTTHLGELQLEHLKISKEDRCIGALLGNVVGDALGGPVENSDLVDDGTLMRWKDGLPDYAASDAGEVDLSTLPPGSEAARAELEGRLKRLTTNTFHLKFGQWTDDSSQALCLADSLLVKNGLDCRDVRVRFYAWWSFGYNNAFRCDRSRRRPTANSSKVEDIPTSCQEHVVSADGNGCLMRLSPVPIFYSGDASPQRTLMAAREQARTTHTGIISQECTAFLSYIIWKSLRLSAADLAVQRFLDEASIEYAVLFEERALLDHTAGAEPRSEATQGTADHCQSAEAGEPSHRSKLMQILIQGKTLADPERTDYVSEHWNWKDPSFSARALADSRGDVYNGYPRDDTYFGSYAPDGLAMALHAVYWSESFAGAVTKAINFGGDTDTVAAIAGQVAGAFYGYSSIAEEMGPYLAELEQWDGGGEIKCRAWLLSLGPLTE